MKARSCIRTSLFFLAASSAWGGSVEDRDISGSISLSAPTTLVVHNLTLKPNAKIVTNGYPLVVSVTGDLNAADGSLIESGFASVPPPAASGKAANGATGVNFNPGPDSEGYGAPGPSGGKGGAGAPGIQGASGRTPGSITVVVLGKIIGKLRISDRGSDGGSGGMGGDGGSGGSGGQGSRAQPNHLAFGIVAGCKAGPGSGGSGGAGGDAGNGGQGGPAGNGGPISMTVVGDSPNATILAVSDPGNPGAPGQPGNAGPPGQPGFGGRGATGCEGREDERRGAPGVQGNSGSIGDQGPPGKTGDIQLSGNFKH